MIEEHAAAAASRPRLELDGAQVAHVMRADDVEPFAPHPAQIGGILLGNEFQREIVRNDCFGAVGCAVAHFSVSMIARVASATSADMFISSTTIFRMSAAGNGSTSRLRRVDSAKNSGSCTICAKACRSAA